MSGARHALVMLSAQRTGCNRNLPSFFLIVQGRKGMNSTASSHSSEGYSSAQLFLEKHLWRPKSSAAPGNVKAVLDRSIHRKSEPTQLEKVADDESRCHTANLGAAAPTLKHFRINRPSAVGAHVTPVTGQPLKNRGTTTQRPPFGTEHKQLRCPHRRCANSWPRPTKIPPFQQECRYVTPRTTKAQAKPGVSANHDSTEADHRS